MSAEVVDMFKSLCFEYFVTFFSRKRQPSARLHESSKRLKTSPILNNLINPLCRTSKKIEDNLLV